MRGPLDKESESDNVTVTGPDKPNTTTSCLVSASQTVYSAAVEKCISHPRVIDFLGDSVKSYGEESRRGRRQHISHLSYEMEGTKGLRLKFYLKGHRRTATANVDARETSSGWEFRYLFVQLDSYPYEVIVIEDNRGTVFDSSQSPGLPDLTDSQ
nr:mitochondrial import inner membrane translocase subunit Tim21-like [Cherax quadricarinatus]